MGSWILTATPGVMGQRYAAMSARIPADSWGAPGDLAGAAVFLASPASAYVSGTALAVDGG